MFQENSSETCILSRVKQITSPGWMHETSAQAWCTGKTQRDWVEGEVGGGIRRGITCKSMADSFQCMLLITLYAKQKKRHRSMEQTFGLRPDSLQTHELYSPWNSPGQNTRVDSLSLLQGIFPAQGSNTGLSHCRWILYQLSHNGSKYQYLDPNTKILIKLILRIVIGKP